MDRRGLLTIWVAIDDVEPEMGPVRYLPGSHRLGPLGRANNSDSRKPLETLLTSARGLCDKPDDYLYEGDAERVGEVVSFPLRAGEAVIHDGLTLHASASNRGDRMRRGWACVYFPSETQYTGMPRLESDGLGLTPFETFDHPRFPVIA
jgi:ectoine hydroxylase-related dioxygenase (phytanoyl-CoA dioxygenase family)